MKTAFNTTEGGCRIDTHRVIPACTQDKCAGGRKPCKTPQLCVIDTSPLARLLRRVRASWQYLSWRYGSRRNLPF